MQPMQNYVVFRIFASSIIKNIAGTGPKLLSNFFLSYQEYLGLRSPWQSEAVFRKRQAVSGRWERKQKGCFVATKACYG